VIEFKDPFNLLSPLPEVLRSMFLETGHPPKLTFVKKVYYRLRPFIPLGVRHLLQSSRKVSATGTWYITDRLARQYERLAGKDRFSEFQKKLWPEEKKSAIVLTHDVETEEGFRFIPRVIEVEQKYGFRSSWNIIPHLYPIDDVIIRLIEESGDEIGIHDYNHDGKLFLSKKIFDKRKKFINESIKKYHASGFRGGAAHRNLLWLQELDIEYDASCFDIDPFQPMPGGTHSIWPFRVGKFIELPYTLPQDHVLWIQLGENTNRIWYEKVQWLYENRGMMLLITHPDYLKEKNCLDLYEELLKYLSTLDDCWRGLPREMTKWWNEREAAQV
jgi:peptidoglycan/xylan/chitin deacetylase (PgdA/CDA1 family)